MTDAGFHQQPEELPARRIWLVGGGVVALGAVLVVIAWRLVAPPAAAEHPAASPSPLEHGLFEHARGGELVRASGDAELVRYAWIDRKARVVRMPIDRAIDAVVADPRLIAARSPAIAGGATSGAAGDAIGGAAGGATGDAIDRVKR